MGVGKGPGRNHLNQLDAIFDGYEAVRDRLPAAGPGGACAPAATLADIADRYDVFLLDAFGVLNVGETAISGAVDRVHDLRAAGKRVLVVSNAAGLPHEALMAKYGAMGFGFASDDVITSRMALFDGLTLQPQVGWAAMATTGQGLEALSPALLRDDPAAYDAAEGFLLIGSAKWTQSRQDMLEDSLRRAPRPVHVGNPDLAAPREIGPSREPGYWAHRLADRTEVVPVFHGKPYSGIYDLAFARLGGHPGRRAVMVGDSLHTDILGAQTAGIASALITGHGVLRGRDVRRAIDLSGIRPDHVIADP
ncbi:HAD-IIA family hydrolase [Jannaschia donghaensis]|uniref:Putative hydrolase YutF n=1 Tax=Jannaschia donghaensis TaxID=420998 RepID=A0A0M6YJU8_9RHOB|nr:HAD hydrolase-like protein [Jannaschia donghaensis]CTQ50631.1 putative hydrolase YutF [Jannaschia donghaensis]